MVISALRNNRLEEFMKVSDHPWLELDRRDPGG
jgi:hypothetical protein